MAARPAREQNTKLPGRWTTQTRIEAFRPCTFIATRSKPTPPLEPKEEREAFIRQWDSLQEFFAHWEKNSEENLAGTFNNYRNLEEFEELFREHFRDFLADQVERGDRTESLEQESAPVEIQPVPRAEFLRFRTRAYFPR